MISLTRFTQVRDEIPGQLGARATKLSALAFPEEVRENAAIQVQLVDLFVDALENKCIRPDIIRDVPTWLSLAIDLAKYSKKVWQKTKRDGVWVRNQECGNQSKRKKALVVEKGELGN